MNPSLSLVDGNTLLIDNSTLETFTTCPRQASYHAGLRRHSSADKSALKFGDIVHKALDARYRACSAMYAQTAEVEKVMIAVGQTEYETWSPPEDDFRTFSCFVELVKKYGTDYPFESFDIVKLPDGTPFVEIPFALPVGDLEINAECFVRDESGSVSLRFVGTVHVVWTGKIDLVVRNEGRLYVWDHKTTSVMGPTYFLDFELSHAMQGYNWAVQTMLGEPVAGYVINCLGVRKPTKTGKAFEFMRKVCQADPWKLTEWQQDTMYIVSDFIENVRRQYAPKHTKWCFGKFGECPYFKVCSMPPEQREMMLSSGEFQDVTWSPLKND